MKTSKQTPIPSAAVMNDKVLEALSNVVMVALSEAPGHGPVELEIFPDAARLILKDAEVDTPTIGAFTRKQSLEVFGMTGVETRRVLQHCIDADRPLRMMVVRAGLSGFEPPVTSLIQGRTRLQ